MFKALLNRRMLVCLWVGFASGMPLYFLIQLVPAWLRRAEIDLKSIGLVALVTLPYSWKFLWSPICDRYALPLGRRRGWMLACQIVLLIAMGVLGFYNPKESMSMIIVVCMIVGIASATQDIVIDAVRREILPEEEFGIGNAMYVNAYRLSSLVPGSLALILADSMPWISVYWIVAGFMGIGILNSLFMVEPNIQDLQPKTLKEAVMDPFREFFGRDGGWRWALSALAFMFLYKLGDNMAVALATPFYIDMGFTNTEIGTVAKVAALVGSLVGGTIGGLVMYRIGLNRALWIFGVFQMFSIFGMTVLSEAGRSIPALAAAVTLEYLAYGMGVTAFASFQAKLTNIRYTATQLALFTSFMSVPRLVSGVVAGFLVEGFDLYGTHFAGLGWTKFYLLCAIMALPGLAMLPKVAPWGIRADLAPSRGSSGSRASDSGATKRTAKQTGY